MAPGQGHRVAKGQGWDVRGWWRNRRVRLTPRHSLGSHGPRQSQARAARPAVYVLCFERSLPSP